MQLSGAARIELPSQYFRNFLPFRVCRLSEGALAQSQPGYWHARLDGRGRPP